MHKFILRNALPPQLAPFHGAQLANARLQSAPYRTAASYRWRARQ